MKTAEEFNRGKLKNKQFEELRQLFRSALADGRISTEELARIQFFYYDSELSDGDFSLLKDNVFVELVEAAIADHQVSEQEHKSILRIAKQLNISPDSREWARRRVQDYSQPGETTPAAAAAVENE